MSTRDIVLIGLLAALLKSSQAVLSFLPNIEIVSLLILIFSIRLGGKKAVYISVLFSILNVMIWGLNPASIGYFAVWSGFALVCGALRKYLTTENRVGIFLGLFGLCFGFLFAISYLPLGVPYVISYWVSGLTFDIVHCISNFIIGIWAFKPVLAGFDRAIKAVYGNRAYIE